MKVSEKIEVFGTIALKEAQDKRAQFLPEIHKEYIDACDKIASEANKTYEEIIEKETYKAEQMKNHEILQANKEARHSLIELRAQLAGELFEEVSAMIADFIETEEYSQLLVKNIAETAKQYSQGIIVSICRRDMALEKEISVIPGVEVAEGDDKMLGGFIARVKGKNIVIDNSYKTRLDDERNSFNGFKITE